MAGELFKHMTGVNLVSVFYKGGGVAISALVGGEAQVGFQSAFLAVNALLSRGVDPAPGTPAEFADFIKSETIKLKKVIDLAGIKPE